MRFRIQDFIVQKKTFCVQIRKIFNFWQRFYDKDFAIMKIHTYRDQYR